MKRDDMKDFLYKKIKLVQTDDFTLYGVIQKINEDSILFETKQATSLIDIDAIKEIVAKKEGY